MRIWMAPNFQGMHPYIGLIARSSLRIAIAQFSRWCCIFVALAFGVLLNSSPIGLTLTLIITRNKSACESRTYWRRGFWSSRLSGVFGEFINKGLRFHSFQLLWSVEARCGLLGPRCGQLWLRCGRLRLVVVSSTQLWTTNENLWSVVAPLWSVEARCGPLW